MSDMLKSSSLVGLATLISRVLGMVREMAFANLLGTSLVAGAFQTAFLIPNLFRRLLGEGALTAAFIPIFKEKEKREGDVATWRAANAVLLLLSLLACGIVVLGVLSLSASLAFVDSSSTTHLMLRLLRVMAFYLPLVCVAAVMMGMLNSRGHFFVPALGSVLLNLVMISVALWIAPRLGNQQADWAFGLAFGVVLAGIAQAIFQVPTLWKEGFRFAWIRPWSDPTVREVARKMAPALVGVAAYQLNVLATQCLAFGLDPTMNSAFGYAVRLMELPQGVFGISLASFLLPTLSALAVDKKIPAFRDTLRQGLDQVVAINLLATVLLIVMAEPIIRLLFEHGSFTPESTARVSGTLQCLAPGLVAFSVVNILSRAFYALGDTRTPMRISLVILAANFVLTMALIFPLRERGMSLANSLSAMANMVWLGIVLRGRIQRLGLAPWKRLLPAKIIAALVAALVAWLSYDWWRGRIGHETLWERLGETFLPMSLAAADYLLLCYLFRVPFALQLGGLLGRRKRQLGG